jgi:hypothetical protein
LFSAFYVRELHAFHRCESSVVLLRPAKSVR